MSFPTISIVNFSDLSDRPVQKANRAVNRQIQKDFEPIWGSIWNLRLHGSSFNRDDINSLVDEFVQGEAVLYIVDEGHLPDAAGYHALNGREIPYGFVFISDPNDWTVTFEQSNSKGCFRSSKPSIFKSVQQVKYPSPNMAGGLGTFPPNVTLIATALVS